MLARDLVELVTESQTTVNAIGDPVISKTYKVVFADKLPIGMNEMYQSNAQGIRPEYKFNIRYFEYNNEQKVRYPITTGKEYSIVRTYNKDDEWIELTLRGVVVNGDA